MSHTTNELEWQRVYRTTNCPTCKAKPGQRCGNPERMLPNHSARIDLYRKVELELNKGKPNRWETIGHAGSE